jgi:hypothetical protein
MKSSRGLDDAARRRLIRERIHQIATESGGSAAELRDDEMIPASGCLDSTGIIELLGWYEDAFEFTLAPKEISLENLGTIARMAAFARLKSAG